MENKLKNLLEKIWNLVDCGAESMKMKEPLIQYNKKSRDKFNQYFVESYKQITEDYMENSEEALDRHKVAAIAIVSIIKANVVTCDDVQDDNVFFGNYTLAVDCSLTYMLFEMNKRLRTKGEKAVDSYSFPQAMACETDYYMIFYRNLYYANNNPEWGLNPLDIAERLFLLEYMTLEKNGIEPSILKEY